MEDSVVVSPEGDDLFDEEQRSSKTSQIEKIQGPLNARIESFTGRNAQTAEEYQIVNYGLCGHNMPHFDTFIERKHVSLLGINTFYKNIEKFLIRILQETRRFGNRLLTVLFYVRRTSSKYFVQEIEININLFLFAS